MAAQGAKKASVCLEKPRERISPVLWTSWRGNLGSREEKPQTQNDDGARGNLSTALRKSPHNLNNSSFH
ncbi:hypothetical protein FOPG_05907 [Fusarium oxysporum f. sp. conglutinans race 2 54008]|nr:hypothetical protein FOVG_01555 [Fusarium oxysporum f. sp. pisi HDV247]EXL80597.1 hypothetical protein FOPG_05907 [Fusarium oxysporum f. sp. conglutinans race 2 54008]EXM28747.1 hypothetical protein FOTG_05897 [Fusarium oxysporum f. sp. vasinfectum 25433]KAI8419102.1 hypothetical protein FOFC_01675 [Fusarium oxysporum]KAJ0138947.1 hypothetical protein HZ326_18119 [Fusarium oxysporum f. sp. albedinis]